MKIAVLEKLAIGLDLDWSPLEALGEVSYYERTQPDEIKERIHEADIIVVNKCVIGRPEVNDALNLKLICEAATGYNNLDVKSLRSIGIDVCNVAGYSTKAVAQHTLTLALSLLEKTIFYDDFVKSKKYSKSGLFTYHQNPICEINGLNWGIIGMGAIGREVARLASAFGANVNYYSGGKDYGIEYRPLPLEKLLKESDILSLHCPLSQATYKMIGKRELSMMKNNALLINVARGPIVDESALAEALFLGGIAGAGLDVFDVEPIPVKSPLLKIKEKVILSPHNAWATQNARQKLLSEIAANIKGWQKGEKRNLVIG